MPQNFFVRHVPRRMQPNHSVTHRNALRRPRNPPQHPQFWLVFRCRGKRRGKPLIQRRNFKGHTLNAKQNPVHSSLRSGIA